MDRPVLSGERKVRRALKSAVMQFHAAETEEDMVWYAREALANIRMIQAMGWDAEEAKDHDLVTALEEVGR
jgi:hypothetical protein